ncbi:MAG: glycosyltransferase [Desulfosalsimonadaceae bacterium]
MKILILADYYEQYLFDFYEHNDLSDLNYEDHLGVLLADYFGSFGSYYHYFKKIGHDVKLIIGNDYRLQTKWLRKRNINITACKKNKKKVVLMQIEEFNPDVFFISSMFDYYGEFLKVVSGITRNIFAWISCPYKTDLDFSNIKCIISSHSGFVDDFRKKGLNAEWLKVAFDSEIVHHLENRKTKDVLFIGGLSKKTHKNRVCALEYLAGHGLDLELYGYGLQKSIWPFMKSPLQQYYRSEAWGLKMYRLLNESKISLNFHIDVAGNIAGNMRMFEATGCNSLLITEDYEFVDSLFKPGEEIITFRNHDDLFDKISYYLAHDQEREEITKRGHQACIERHGYDIRIKEFEKILERHSL